LEHRSGVSTTGVSTMAPSFSDDTAPETVVGEAGQGRPKRDGADVAQDQKVLRIPGHQNIGMAVHHPAVTREDQGQKHHPKLDWSIIDHLQTLPIGKGSDSLLPEEFENRWYKQVQNSSNRFYIWVFLLFRGRWRPNPFYPCPRAVG